MRVALVHDFLLRFGGAERVLATLAEMFPEAPIYTLLYDEQKLGGDFPARRIVPSSLQRLPTFFRKRYRFLLPLMPRALEQWDFSGFDLVISSSTALAHGIITPSSTYHLSYCHSPARYCWDWTHAYARERGGNFLQRVAAAYTLHKLRMWDRASSDRVDGYIANSKHVAARISKYYRAPSQVLYPPVQVDRFKISKKKSDYFLIVSTLTPYKRVELAVQLFNLIRKPLVIIGDGPQREFLENIAGDTITFLGRQDDAIVARHISECRALLFPGEEDFGITPIEAMAAGKPVLAYGVGGVCESVIEGITGEFFWKPTVASMQEGLARLMKNESTYDPQKCRAQAEKFSEKTFIEAMHNLIRTLQKTGKITSKMI